MDSFKIFVIIIQLFVIVVFCIDIYKTSVMQKTWNGYRKELQDRLDRDRHEFQDSLKDIKSD